MEESNAVNPALELFRAPTLQQSPVVQGSNNGVKKTTRRIWILLLFLGKLLLNFFDKIGYQSSLNTKRLYLIQHDRSLNACQCSKFCLRQVFVCRSHFDSEIGETTAFLNLCREQCKSTCQFLPSKILKLFNSRQ